VSAVIFTEKFPKWAKNRDRYKPEMCKSQFREVPHPEVQPCMLLSDELHNWLLFMDLKADQEGRRTDRVVVI